MASKNFSLRHLLSGKYQKLTQVSSPSRPEISYRLLDKTRQPENMLMARVAEKKCGPDQGSRIERQSVSFRNKRPQSNSDAASPVSSALYTEKRSKRSQYSINDRSIYAVFTFSTFECNFFRRASKSEQVQFVLRATHLIPIDHQEKTWKIILSKQSRS
jgi:hypothetical protein